MLKNLAEDVSVIRSVACAAQDIASLAKAARGLRTVAHRAWPLLASKCPPLPNPLPGSWEDVRNHVRDGSMTEAGATAALDGADKQIARPLQHMNIQWYFATKFEGAFIKRDIRLCLLLTLTRVFLATVQQCFCRSGRGFQF